MISIIISFKDKALLLKKCIKSFLDERGVAFEVILVNNGSKKPQAIEYLKSLENEEKIRILNYDKPFNFSAINNFAAKQAKGDYLLFLNNDTEVISENWLEKMLECFADEKVGAVGAKLLYPDETIQHAGVQVGKNVATHQFLGFKEEELGDNDVVRQVDAVTGACMMTRKNLFLQLGGFDEENLPIAYNDVDYCLKLKEKGFKIIWTPGAKLFHFESASRKSDVNLFARIFRRKRFEQFKKEQAFLIKKWHLLV